MTRQAGLIPAPRVEIYVLILRAISMRGQDQREAIDEIHRRGAWLAREQQIAAGFPQQADYARDYDTWFKERRRET